MVGLIPTDTSSRENSSRVLVIIPVHNEVHTIAKIIDEVRTSVPELDVLVIDDASTDGSSEAARLQRAIVVRLPFNLGIGGAVQTGFKLATQQGYDVVVQVDGDGQHDPSYIKDLVEPIIKGSTDISIGSRHLLGGNSKSSITREAGMRFFSWLTSCLISVKVTDCSSGFRALGKKAFTLFSEQYPVDFPDAEALISAHRAGLRISEIPVKFRTRENGHSSLHSWRLLYYPFKETFSILISLTHRPSHVA